MEQTEPRKLPKDKFVLLVFREGVISTLIGLPEGGKSNLANKFMEFLVARGYDVYTNIGYFKRKDIPEAMEKGKLAYVKNWEDWYWEKPQAIHTVRSLSDLFIGLLTTERNTVVLDEAGIHISSKSTMSKEAKSWEQIAFIIRHLSSSFLLVTQEKTSITPTLREKIVQFEMKVRKYSNRNRAFTIATAVEFVDDFTGESSTRFEVAEADEYHYISKTHLPYDGKDIPYFDMDLDLTECYKRLSMRDDGSPINSLEIRKGSLGINIIKQLKKEMSKSTRVQTKKDMIMTEFFNDTDLSLKGIAKKYDTTYQTVCNYHSVFLQETE